MALVALGSTFLEVGQPPVGVGGGGEKWGVIPSSGVLLARAERKEIDVDPLDGPFSENPTI